MKKSRTDGELLISELLITILTGFLVVVIFILLCDNIGRGQMKEWGEGECRTHGLDFVNYSDNSTESTGVGTIFVTCFNTSGGIKFQTNMTMVKG